MLIAQSGREASGQGPGYGGKLARDHEMVALHPDQLAANEDGEPVREGSAAPVHPEADQPQQLGDRTRTDGGHPEPSHIGIGGGEAAPGGLGSDR